MPTNADREADASATRRRGVDAFNQVYGSLPVSEPGESLFFDTMLEQLFAGIWARPGLTIRERRLLTMGALAGLGATDKLGFQFATAVEKGELTPDQVDEVVLHLTAYVGWPRGGDMYNAALAGMKPLLDRARQAGRDLRDSE